MSQSLAVGNSHQHSVSLVLSWNTSLLPPRPEAEQGRTPWLRDKAAWRRILVWRLGGERASAFCKAVRESGPGRVSFLPLCLSVSPCSNTPTCDPSQGSLHHCRNMRETLVLASRRHSSTGDGCWNQGVTHQPPPIQLHAEVGGKSTWCLVPCASVFCGCASGSKGWWWRKGVKGMGA